MLQEYCFTPEVFDASAIADDPALGRVLVQVMRDLCDSGLIARLNKDQWLRDVNARVDALPQQLRTDLKACLETLSRGDRLVGRPVGTIKRPASDGDWLAIAIAEHARMPFEAIVSTRAVIGAHGMRPGIIELSELLDSPRWRDRRRDQFVSRNLSDYSRLLRPIVRYARHVHMIDPYMSYWNDAFFGTFVEVVKLAGQRGNSPVETEIHIHALDPADRRFKQGEQVTTCLDNWEKRVSPMLTAALPHTVHVHLWGQRSSGPPPHDRFVVTNQCAVAVLGGLDCQKTGSTIWVSLSDESRSSILTLIDRHTSPFQLLGERVIRRPAA